MSQQLPHITQSINFKIKSMLYAFLIIFFIITLRLAYLQISLSPYFIQKSSQNYSRIEHSLSPRGNIVDRNGALLATNRPVINVYWQGTGSYFLTQKQRNLLNSLEIIFNKPLQNNVSQNSLSQDNLSQNMLSQDTLSPNTLASNSLSPIHTNLIHANLINTNLINTGLVNADLVNAERYYKEKILAKDISLEQLSKIEESFPMHPNIRIKTGFQRLYPNTYSAGHILGYLSRSIDNESSGKMGLEKILEQSLKGESGQWLATVNSVGRKLANKEIRAARTGKNVETTLDITLQKICDTVFPEDYTGAMIVMDPINGDILALISRPTFDPSLFLSPISSKEWHTLQEKKPFINRAFSTTYPPGSIFKLVTLSAALEHNIVTPETECNCRGYINFGGRHVLCHQKWGHGKLSLSQALANSCNIVCYEIGQKIDIDILAHYAYLFGFGQKTNTLFAEQEGLIPSRAWKRKTKNQPWWPGETLSVCIGQSFLLVTPIQVAAMISSIFTGYLPTPRLLLAESIQKKPLTITQETRNFLKKSMKLVTTAGTGRGASIKDYQIYAKTSTAQTSALEKRTLDKKYLEHAWFAAYAQYKDSPPLTIVILAENSGSSKTATKIAKNFLLRFKELIDSNSYFLYQTANTN